MEGAISALLRVVVPTSPGLGWALPAEWGIGGRIGIGIGGRGICALACQHKVRSRPKRPAVAKRPLLHGALLRALLRPTAISNR